MTMMFTLPTWITLGRLLALPVLVWLVLNGHMWWALAVYTLGALTDFLDGYLARKLNQISAFGTFLDPIADKIYVCALFVALLSTGSISGAVGLPAVIIILSREFLVSGLREYLGPKNVQLPVTKLAKWKTAAQMVATAFLIVANYHPHIALSGAVLLNIAALLTVLTGALYMRAAWPHLND